VSELLATVVFCSLLIWRHAMLWHNRLVTKKRCSRLFRFRPLMQVLEDRTLPSFLPAVNYPVGSNPHAVAVGDFNGDGTPDLVVANSSSDTVSVLLGNGDGSFRAAQDYRAGPTPFAVAVGDFNGDGVPDLAVANNVTQGTVSILLGNGDGSFQAPVSYRVGTWPTSVAVADFNGDGIPDLAVANELAYGVTVLLGNGDGSFRPAVSSGAGLDPYAVAVGDFNGDGIPDLAVTNYYYLQGVSILLGNGDGTFVHASSINDAADGWHNAVAVGDFNGDGIPDLAVTSIGSESVSVFLGNGDGTFQHAVSYGVDSYGRSVAVADFNGDGLPDLAVANSADAVSVLLGNGDGTFQPAVNYAVGTNPMSVAVEDFNGDGFPDLAVANYASATVSVLLNAVDWPGGSPGARSQPSPSAIHGIARSQGFLDPLSAHLTVHDSQALAQGPLTATDLQLEPAPQVPVATHGDQSGAPEAASNPQLFVAARHAPDAAFEGWADPLGDLRAMSLLWPTAHRRLDAFGDPVVDRLTPNSLDIAP
jgi:hypothetical protein